MTNIIQSQPRHKTQRLLCILKRLLHIHKVLSSRFRGKPTPPFGSYQTVGVYLLGLDLLVCCDLLDVLLSFLQPVTNRAVGQQMNLSLKSL